MSDHNRAPLAAAAHRMYVRGRAELGERAMYVAKDAKIYRGEDPNADGTWIDVSVFVPDSQMKEQ